MRHGDARFGHQFFEHGAPVVYGFDLVMQEIRLAAPLEFAQQGFAYGALVFATHECFDREPFLRRGGDHRKSRMPSSDMPSVRGMGVAVSVSTSTSARSFFRA